MAPLTHLSRTGEVGEFLDDNQFAAPGGSDNKCGPESIALCIHSVAPGQQNPHSSADIHRTAHNDYVRFVDPVIGNNPGGSGIDDPTFYRILEFHTIEYRTLPLDWSLIREWLQHGYPVIIGGVREDTIHDAGLGGASPYDWGNLDERWHIITATGPGSHEDRLKFRDTANVGRRGPREYFHERFSFTLATVFVPKWMPVPPRNALRPEGEEMLQITDDFARTYFQQIQEDHWHCGKTKKDVIGGILKFYRRIGGSPRLPLTAEKRDIPGLVYQVFESGIIAYDPDGSFDHPSGFPDAYLMKFEDAQAHHLLP